MALGGSSLEPTRLGSAPADESALVAALRGGDASAFFELVVRHHAAMVRLAGLYVRDRDIAEEVAQQTWLGALEGIHRFESRSSIRTWLFRILTNIAKTRAQREARTIPFSSLWGSETDSAKPAVDPDHFLPADHPRWPGHWQDPPPSWGGAPEEQALSAEMQAHLRNAVGQLTPSQREVISLRDVEGWTAEEVCNALSITATNQRVLLHRARTRVRHALDEYLLGAEGDL